MQALSLWQRNLARYVLDLGPQVLERGIISQVAPPERPGVAAEWREQVRLADSPETLAQLLKEREEQVGRIKMLQEFSALAQPPVTAAQPNAAALGPE